jgi:23S rRNA (adenine2503-C2)-methyltransferase
LKILARREVPGLATLYLAELDAARRVEFVDTLEPGAPKSEKWVMMISTQAGCAVGCRMCDAGATGYQGNLSAPELLGQIRFIAAQNPGLDLARHPKVEIHFARMGEPALNPAVLEALRGLARQCPGPGVIVSVSTVAPKSPAVAPWFEELRRIKSDCFPGGRFQLQFSLHATDEGRRREIIPIKKWTLEEVADYGRRFVRPGDRKVTLNFAPGPGATLDAAVIARVFDPEHFLVKVTAVNPTLSARRSQTTHVWNEAPRSVRAAEAELRRRGFAVILAPGLPEEIASDAACGQLWSGDLKAAARAGLRAERRERRSYVTVDSMDRRCEAWLRRARRRRGPRFDPRRAALLVLDMRESFLDRRSAAYLPPARAALLNVRRLVEAFRRAGRPVLFSAPVRGGPRRDGARVAAGLEPREADVYPRTGRSAFSNPGLERRLRAEGVAHLVLAGVKTDFCVESTARAAFDLGWLTFVAADATAARSEEQHVAALRAMARGFSLLTRVEEVIGKLAIETPKS